MGGERRLAAGDKADPGAFTQPPLQGNGQLDGTRIKALPLDTNHGARKIALAWRRSSPREEEFLLLSKALRSIAGEVRRTPVPA